MIKGRIFLTLLLLTPVLGLTVTPNSLNLNVVENETLKQTITLLNNNSQTLNNINQQSENESIIKIIKKPTSLLPKQNKTITTYTQPLTYGLYYTKLRFEKKEIPIFLSVSANNDFNVLNTSVEERLLTYSLKNNLNQRLH